jgi:hypothetical protein
MLTNKLLETLRGLFADPLDDVRLGAEDAVLMVKGDGLEVRGEEGRQPDLVEQDLLPRIKGNLNVVDGPPEFLTDNVRHFPDGHVSRPSDHKALSDVPEWLRENSRHNASNVPGSDWGVALFSIGKVKLAFAGNGLGSEDQEHFGEKGRADMDSADAGPIEDVFGEPVLTRQRTLGAFAGRQLRHVHERLNPRVSRGDRQIARGFDERLALRRVAEVDARTALHGPPQRLEIEEVADHDLCSESDEAGTPLVSRAGEGANGKTSLPEEFNDVSTGLSGRSCHENQGLGHEITFAWCIYNLVVQKKRRVLVLSERRPERIGDAL